MKEKEQPTEVPARNMQSLRFWQIVVFAIGWLSYASTYFLRKPLGVIKADLESSLSFTTAQLGLLDTALLMPYALMQIILGPLGDKFGVRKTFSFALMGAAMSMVFFGRFSSFYAFFLLLFLNGTAQSQCWPNVTKGLLNWFSSEVRNSVFGIFGTCCFAGGVIGTMFAVYLQANYGWRTTYMYPSMVVFCMGIIVLLFFRQPEDFGMVIAGKGSEKEKGAEGTAEPVEKPRMLDLWRLPMIPEVSIAVFCLKVVRYCMYMWLPMYLLKALNYSQSSAGIFSTVFEVGGMIGSALVGFAMDRYYKNQALRGIGLFCFISTMGLLMFTLTSSYGVQVNSLCMFIAGAFNAGPDILLCGTIPAELVEKHNKHAAIATIALVNGFGSIGTFIEGPIVGLITDYFGWSGMFYFMIGLSALGTVATYRASFIHARESRATIDYIEGV